MANSLLHGHFPQEQGVKLENSIPILIGISAKLIADFRCVSIKVGGTVFYFKVAELNYVDMPMNFK